MSDLIKIEISARQLWAMVLLVVGALGGGSGYVGRTASNLQENVSQLSTTVSVLNETVKGLSAQTDLKNSHASDERSQIRARLDRLEGVVFQRP